MSEKRNFNPLFLLVGMVVGAVGAVLATDKQTRKKARTALIKAEKSGKTTAGALLGRVKKITSNMEVLNGQGGIDGKTKKK
jgi:hypothetical protein